MTALTNFFCDYCNPSRQVRDPGDEVTTGFTVENAGDFPLTWWEVPGKGPHGSMGHACPTCANTRPEFHTDMAKRRGAAAVKLLQEGEHDDGPGEVPGDATTSLAGADDRPAWPSSASPFDGPGDGGARHER